MGSTCSGCMSSSTPANNPQFPESSTSALNEEDRSELEKLPESPKKRPTRKSKIIKQMSRRVAEVKSAKVLNRVKSKLDEKLILRVLNDLPILKPLEDSCKYSIMFQMKWFLIEGKEIVYEEGNPSLNFYIVHSGKLEFVSSGNRLGLIKPGEFFGEPALLDSSNRPCTVRSIEKSILWAIDNNTYKKIIEEFSAQESKEMLEFINSVPIFNPLTQDQKLMLSSLTTVQSYNIDDFIITKGEPGDTLHIVKEGTVKVVIDGKVMRTMTKGAFYGEQALIQRCPRTASIIAESPVKVVIIGQGLFNDIFGSSIEEVIFQNTIKLCLEKTVLFKDPEVISQILSICKITKFSAGSIIVKKDVRKSHKLLIVIKGSLRTGTTVFSSYDVLGDVEMQKNSKEKFSQPLVAESDSVVSEVSKKHLEKFMETKVNSLSTVNELLQILPKVSLFRYLTNEKLKALLKNLKEEMFPAGASIINQGEIGEKLYIIKAGSVNVVKNGECVRVLPTGSFFGERAILFNENRSAGVVAAENSICWVLDKQGFDKVVDEKMNKILINRIELQNDSINLNELVPIKVIGRGTHGVVYLCSDLGKKALYALKTVTRQKISAFELFENLATERSILMRIDNLMIVKLVKTFKDSLRIYFLMEYIKGFDLFEVISRFSQVGIKDCQFFVACLVLILEFLHKGDILYRDLKPENVIVDDEGYLKLIDFGSAKVVKGKTFTSLGTPHYMAPEIMSGTGYTDSVDWWSLGILMYELLEGEVPFAPNDEDPMSIYDKILQHNIEYNHITSNEARGLIEQFLNLKPALRTLGKIEKIKNHPFFAGLKWEAILCRQAKPGFIPKVNDISNEIARAFKAKKLLRDFLSREESSDVLHRQNTKPMINHNWDVEF